MLCSADPLKSLKIMPMVRKYPIRVWRAPFYAFPIILASHDFFTADFRDIEIFSKVDFGRWANVVLPGTPKKSEKYANG